MIKKLLIANRGEIVSRIIRTCKDMGISTVAVYSEPDKNMPYLDIADNSVLIGQANPLESYLNIEALINAAIKTKSDAIHPGYGFLSERGTFAKAVEKAGLIWVGPSSETLKKISSKSYCRHIANKVNVPVIPGTLKPISDSDAILTYGKKHGWPLFLKLDKGGGGKGIEIIKNEREIKEAFKRAISIGKMAFGSSDCYIERLIKNPRHIEIQFIADKKGKCICLGERECSLQRRCQKIIEEAPFTDITEQERQTLFERTKRIVREIGYTGAGTIENLRDADGNFYFMEINARLQVEHPITEFVTGTDIVKWQLSIAAGEKLDCEQKDIKIKGHSIEARVYAENPKTFIPSPGSISFISLPKNDKNIRIDHALKKNLNIPPYYDPLLAKVISYGTNRAEATRLLIAALQNCRIKGIETTIPVNLAILNHPDYLAGKIDTKFIDKILNH
ncbi:MAG: ATP-grasp domain-containing protein [Deltaproteobacteria bacterium]|nr:ATP-grasp domain-containing protein [Deltaproteobacteria bacterium]